MKSNPFNISTEVNSKFFCNRKYEIDSLITSFLNNKNSFLYSHKGLGKTTLLKHIKSSKLMSAEIVSYYINCLNFDTFYDFLNHFVFKLLDREKNEKFFNKGNKDNWLNEVNNLFKDLSNTNILVILDDFQQIVKGIDLEFLKRFLSITEKQNKIKFIFGGNYNEIISLIHILKLNENPKYTFLKLEEINSKTISKFIRKTFKKHRIKINKENANYIIDLTGNVTYFTQFLCNRLYKEGEKEINKKDIDNVLNDILIEKELNFITYKNLVSFYQWKLIYAIANEGIAKQITSMEFIQKYSLNAPSSVKTAEKSLLDKNLIYKENNKYKITDVFFAKWLVRNNL